MNGSGLGLSGREGKMLWPSAADTGRAGASVVADPAHRVSVEAEFVAIGAALHPARPFLAELIVGDPPFAAIGRAIAAGEGGGDRAHAALHGAAG